MVDDFHSDVPGLGFIEGPGGIAVQCGPGFFVVVSIHEPTGDALGAIAANESPLFPKTEKASRVRTRVLFSPSITILIVPAKEFWIGLL